MSKRVISGAIFILLVILIGIINIPIVDTIVLVILSLIGMYEYIRAFKSAGYNPISSIGYISCFAIFFIGAGIPTEIKLIVLRIALPLGLILLFGNIIMLNLKRNILDIAITVFGVIYVPFLFAISKYILVMENGRFLYTFALCAAWANDTCAFLIGRKFGKHKLCPEISPKKTIEGAIGGIAGVVISFIILTLIGIFGRNMDLNIIYMILVAIVTGVAGQLGDLSASAIKRFCKVKDFGNIMPGHGGILDRFDSLLFVVPVMYALIKLYII